MTKKKLALVIACPVLAVTALVFGGYQAWQMMPPSMPQTVDDVEALFEYRLYVSCVGNRGVPTGKILYLEHSRTF